MCSVHALTAIMREYPLTPEDRAFCRALLQQGEVLAVMLDYVPESLVWLVSTSGQAWLLRERQPGVVALSLHEVADFAGAIASQTRSIDLSESLVALNEREQCERRIGKVAEADADLHRIQELAP